MKSIIFIGLMIIVSVVAKCHGEEIKKICSLDNIENCLEEEVNFKNKRGISHFLNSLHPSFIKKMDRMNQKNECTTKMCLITNLFKLANSILNLYNVFVDISVHFFLIIVR